MKKVFLYLYPIKEFQQVFTFDDNYYKENNISKPFPILNKCIQKRYRDNDYQVIFALYPDKNIYGIVPTDEDKIIYTDITFEQATSHNGLKRTEKESIAYSDEKYLIEQIEPADKLVVGGYHAQDCVKRVAEYAYASGIDTIIDLDLTDMFFTLYKKSEYFNIDYYNPNNYQNYINTIAKERDNELITKLFERNFSSIVYGFSFNKEKAKREVINNDDLER